MDTPEQPAVGRVRREALASSVVAELQPSSGRLQAPGWSAGNTHPARGAGKEREAKTPEPGAAGRPGCPGGGDVRRRIEAEQCSP